MKKLGPILIIFAFGILLTIAHQKTARAGPSDGEANCARFSELVAFVAEETGYPPMRKCPRVTETTTAQLRSIFVEASAHGEEPLAAFLPAKMEILLGPDIDLATPLGRSYIVHEIVHVFQFANGGKAIASCNGLLESKAYWVQASYLRNHDLLKTVFKFELLSMMYSACGHRYSH